MLIALAVILCVTIIALMVPTIRECRTEIEARKARAQWPTIQGSVCGSEKWSWDTYDYVDIRFWYEVKGIRYSGTQTVDLGWISIRRTSKGYRVATFGPTSTKGSLVATLKLPSTSEGEVPANTPVTVYYNPANPGESFLVNYTKDAAGGKLSLVILLAVTIACLVVIATNGA